MVKMFEGKIEKKILKEAIETIVSVTDEARLQITNEGFSLKVVDAASVAMCDFSLQKDAFVQYTIDEPKTVGMDFAKLLDMISVGGKEEVELKMDASKYYKLEGDKLIRTHRSCPKCGPGVFLSKHSDREYCGQCGYVEMKSKEAPKEESKTPQKEEKKK